MYLFTAGMGIGLTGLQAAQNGINVTGQNIANINTPGYSRQRVNLETGFAVQIDKLQFGLGVNVNQIQSIRDRFLDMQLTQTITRMFGTKTRYEGVENVASLFMENGESGFGIELQRFFQSFEELSARPEDDAVRTNVVTRAQTWITGLQSRYALIEEKQAQANRSVASIVNEVNTLTSEIARLNHQIESEVPKGSDNNSRDQRQALVNKLAELVGIQVYEDTQERLTITLENGIPIVSGTRALTMLANKTDEEGHFQVEVRLGNPGVTSLEGETIDVTSAIKSGALGGMIDLRDNLLPEQLAQLNQLAAGVVEEVNKLHISGYGLGTDPLQTYFFVGLDFDDNINPNLPPNGIDPDTNLPYVNGQNVAINMDNDYKGLIKTLRVNPLVVDNPRYVASSSSYAGQFGPDDEPGPGNNMIALRLAELQDKGDTVKYRTKDGVVTKGPFSTFISSMANKIGNMALKLQADANTDENVRVALEIQRDRLSAVDFDEEATNLMVYQRSYQACSRFINVINQLLDQLINNFGR
ncbi:MAG: flagellar hook-associated protein FlgK [Holophagaceae bacterium]|nr:flagellar hook-associated protein FlgK [Holophagaceae bacterium]